MKALGTHKVILSPVHEADAWTIADELKHEKIDNLSFFSKPITYRRELEYIFRMMASPTDQLYTVWHKQDSDEYYMRMIGTAGLHEIDRYMDTVRPGLLIFPRYRGKGFANGALYGLLHFAFIELGLNLVYLKVFPENTVARALYRKFGFIEEGVLRQRYKLKGAYHDMVSMSLTRDEWIRINEV